MISLCFPVINDVEHLCMCLFVLYKSSLGTCLFKFLSDIFFLLIELWEFFICFWYKSFVRHKTCKDFSPSPWLIFLLLKVFWKTDVLIFMKSNVLICPSVDHAFGKTFAKLFQRLKGFLWLFFSSRFYSFGFHI